MPMASMYDEEYFVVLETNQPEQIMDAQALRDKLTSVLLSRREGDRLAADASASIADQVKMLLDTTCELDMPPGEYLQWYATRLEK